MEAKQYQTEFSRTLAPVFFPEHVSPIYVGLLMQGRCKSAELVDAVKRALIHGNKRKLEELGGSVVADNDLNLPFNVPVDDLHAILGLEGEVSELTQEVLFSDGPREVVRQRVVDESGDLLWYLHLLFKSFGITLDEVFAANIAKLAKRYPDKFSTDLAVNRDLEAEAEVFDQLAGLREAIQPTMH